MPVDIEIDVGLKRVVNRVSGALMGAELLNVQQRIRQHPNFLPDFTQLFDLSRATEVHVTAEDVRSIAAATPFCPTARRALVVSGPLQFGLARMFSSYIEANGGAARVCTTLDDALEWLNGGSG